MNRCSLIRGVHYETYQSTIYQLPEFNIQIAVYQFYIQGPWTTRKMLMQITLTLLSWCVSIHLHHDVLRSLPSCVVISSINMPRPCQHHKKNQLNCLGGCVRSLTLPNWYVHWMSISSGLTTTALLAITVLQYRNVITVDICNCGSYLAFIWSTEMFMLVIIKKHKLAITRRFTEAGS